MLGIIGSVSAPNIKNYACKQLERDHTYNDVNIAVQYITVSLKSMYNYMIEDLYNTSTDNS